MTQVSQRNVDKQITKAIEDLYLQAVIYDYLPNEELFSMGHALTHKAYVPLRKSGQTLCFDEELADMEVCTTDNQHAMMYETRDKKLFQWDYTSQMFGFTPVSSRQSHLQKNGKHVITWTIELLPQTSVGPRLCESLFKTHEVVLTFSNHFCSSEDFTRETYYALDFQGVVARPKFVELDHNESAKLLRVLEDAIALIDSLKLMCALRYDSENTSNPYQPFDDYVEASLPNLLETGMFRIPPQK